MGDAFSSPADCRCGGALPGGTLPEKIEGFVLSLGFSRNDIEKLRGLLLE